MKNLFLIIILSLHIFFNGSIYAQVGISNVSSTQSFESPFNISPDNCTGVACNVEIVSSFFANEAKTTSRIYRETKGAINGKGSLGMIAIEGFTPTLEIAIPVTDAANLQKLSVEFDAKSLKNGSIQNTRYATLYYSYATNKEKIYTAGTLIDVFMNKDSDAKKYQFEITLPPTNFKDIQVKLYATRSKDSTGTCAKVIIDDITTVLQYNVLAVDGVNSAENNVLKITCQIDTKIELNKAISGQILNTIGMVVAEVNNTAQINTSALSSGLYFIKAVEQQNITKFYIK